MDLAVKQRILGGVVLLAGAVLFLPLLLEGAGVRALQPPAPPAAPKVPDTTDLAPAITREAAALEADISASHGEPTFYPVQPPVVTVPAPEPAVEQQFRMVTPSAGAPAATAPVAPATAPAASQPRAAPAPVAQATPVEPKPDALLAANADAAAKAEAAAAARAKADAEARAKAEAAAKAKLEAATRAKEDAAARAKADAEARAKAAALAKSKADAASAAKAAAASKPVVADADPAAAQAWVVQVASLSSKAKADALVATLRAKGYRAGIGGQEGAWRVSIGPELDRAVAESVKARVAADPALKLSGWIQAYRP